MFGRAPRRTLGITGPPRHHHTRIISTTCFFLPRKIGPLLSEQPFEHHFRDSSHNYHPFSDWCTGTVRATKPRNSREAAGLPAYPSGIKQQSGGPLTCLTARLTLTDPTYIVRPSGTRRLRVSSLARQLPCRADAYRPAPTLDAARRGKPGSVFNVAIGSRAAIFFPMDRNSPEYIDGMELPQGQILVFGLHSVGHLRTGAGSQWGTMSLTFEDLAAAGQAIIGREVIAPSDTHCIRPPPQLMSRLSRLHGAAGHLAKTAPDILANPEVARAMEQALVHAMVSCLSGERPPRPATPITVTQ